METKQRHGCVTAWLIFIIVVNSIVALMYIFARGFVLENFQGDLSPIMLILLAILGILNVVFAILILKWKKIGFWGFVGTGIVVFIINLIIGIPIFQSLIGLIGIALLFGILQIKREGVSSWENLE